MSTFLKTNIKGLYVIEPKVFGDERGYFLEEYNKNEFDNNGLNYCFVQDNRSKSKKGVLRGLHFQKKHPQAKLVTVIEGEVFDVAVDLRKGSKTFGSYFSVILSDKNKKMFMIPKGFAHGFLVLSKTAVLAYKCDDFYHPEDEGGIAWNDPTLNINWPSYKKVVLSSKDKALPFLSDLEELDFE